LVGIGWAGRTALTEALGPTALPFIFFFPLIALAAWFGGFGPGVLATVLSAAIADYFFFEPLHTWVVYPHERWAFGAFGLAALAILGAIESMHRAKAKLAESRDLLATTFSSIGDGVIVTDDRAG